ncbi:MAG: single-stranded-DNA-specific exonuclease RecJ [SAR202 cluster bacterium Io17-Chloro-G4]|nr:MAG: single-stranded-DNA-specific exonuclease RecJ [SAR202 cluster bacterium Io17-Chloro-G4]
MIENSVDGGAKRWELPQPISDHSLSLDLQPAAIKVLLRRGIDTPEKLKNFFDPPHRLPYDPMRLEGMEAALKRLYQAIDQHEAVGVFGDFDVDGVTGTAIIAEGLEAFDVKALPYIPRRSGEGHGLSTDAIDQLVAEGASVIVTVDCGVTSFEEVAYAKKRGADVIITDHHLPYGNIPDAVAIIDPKLPGGTYPFESLCGAGLAFKLIQGLYQYCGQPWDNSLLELAALGTIADLVPLVDENRFLVREGLKALANTKRPGLQSLFRRAGVIRPGVEPGPITTETISFQVGPRLNSPGRLGHALDSYLLLTTKSSDEADSVAEKLEELNQKRRGMSEEAITFAFQQIQDRLASADMPSFLMVQGPSITRGVAGLVAGRLAETYHRPAVAVCVEDEYAVGSGRSIPEFDIFKAFSGCEDLFVRFGGHSQAAGFTVEVAKLPVVEERLVASATGFAPSGDLRPMLTIDAEVEFVELGGEFPKWVSTLEPFGAANPQPMFLTRRAQVLEVRRIGKSGQHLNIRLGQGDHQWTALAFNQADRWIDGTQAIDFVYTLIKDYWQGVERLNLKVLDYRASGNYLSLNRAQLFMPCESFSWKTWAGFGVDCRPASPIWL